MIIAVVNNKGGVGKTTASVNLAAALCLTERRVLLVDLDSQASASLWCGLDARRPEPSSANCLLDGYPVDRAIRKTRTPNMDLIAGSMELANADIALCDVPGRELTLRKALQPIRKAYPFVILDCPPALSLVGVNALVAADALIVPVTPQYLAVEGLVNLLAAIDRVRARLRRRLRLLGLLISIVDERRPGAAEYRERLRAQYRETVFHTEIAHARALGEAPARSRTIFESAPRSRSADEFRRLAGEVLGRARTMRALSVRRDSRG